MSSNKDKKAFTPAMETALERFRIIAPLLNSPTEEVNLKITKIAKKIALSPSTIRRYYNRYKLNGIDGLIPLKNERPGCRSISLKTYGTGGQMFQRNERNRLWQSDAKHATYNNYQKKYLISFLDI
jgi:hypothetical protein